VSEPIRSYHARRGRLSPNQRDVLARRNDLDLAVWPDPIDLDVVFNRRAPRTLEIGSGLGDTALELAAQHPDFDYIAADVHTKGIARTLLHLEARNLNNLRVLHGDALDFISRRLPPQSLDEVLVFFPDPWPKARHHKRRLVRREFAQAVGRVLKPGGALHLATDIGEYADVMQTVLDREPLLRRTYRGPRIPTRARTKYEVAGEQKGRLAVDLVYLREAPSKA
jgi:tRNA (guanine-N7-)-methyltransferase